MYLKILQKLRCLVAFQNKQSAPIGRDKNSVYFKFLEEQFYKAGKAFLCQLEEKIRILLKSPFPSVRFSDVFLTLKFETLVFFTMAIELSHFCLSFEDFCLGLTFSHGPRDSKRFGREKKWGLGTRQSNFYVISDTIWFSIRPSPTRGKIVFTLPGNI